MKQGDFTALAKNYINRPGYSSLVLDVLSRALELGEDSQVADVGAGTGKLTELLFERFQGLTAVEPNDEMRSEGVRLTPGEIDWRAGSAEENDLEDDRYDWITMASSFHWTNPETALPRISRALKPGAAFSIMWNPRNIVISEFHTNIEAGIREIVPELKRVSSGAAHNTKDWTDVLGSTGHFDSVFFVEACHEEIMTADRYLGAWRSVNDIQAQAGPERWEKIMAFIEEEISGLEEIVVPYKTRAWTCKKR